MNLWTWFSPFYFFAAVTISQLFIEEKLRLVFLLIIFLPAFRFTMFILVLNTVSNKK